MIHKPRKNVIASERAKRNRRRLNSARLSLETLESRELLAVYISEVHSAGSGNGTYAADWFELTNTGSSAVDITGWKMDDNSNSFASAVALRGLTSIPAGKSAVFLEGTATGLTAPTDATILANFSNAWFGSATPPSGFVYGFYGGSGVGLSSTADAVNVYNSSGVLQANVSFAAATANKTFDNAAGLNNTTISQSSVAGTNSAILSANGLETGSPGNAITTVDLSRYVRVGRYDLPEPTRTVAPANSLLAQEASSVTYNWDTDTLFIVGDGGTSVVQVSKTGQLLDSMTLAPGGSPQGTEFYDTEGLTYVGGGKFVLLEERYRQANLFTYVPGSVLHRADVQTVKLGTTIGNIGLEGISFDPQTNGFIAVKEKAPESIFQTGIDFVAGTATNGSPTATSSTDLFNPTLAGLADFSDVFALSNLPSLNGLADSSRLLVLSQESGQIINVDRSGNVFSRLTIVADPGSPLTVPDMTNEGVTMDRTGFLYVVNENGGGDANHPQLWVYAPSFAQNVAPTAVTLANSVPSIPENTSTAAAVKVADIDVSDDGLGVNNLALTGTDASSFQIVGTALYLKAGTVLNSITKPSYSVAVTVDDASLGGTPDATSSNYTLSITAATGGTPALIISEVAPWSSGNSPLAADWFEVTNTGTAAANITGWKMDDNSFSAGSAVPLVGISSIAPGESVVFIEAATTLTPAQVAALPVTFKSLWFGANPPANLKIGTYSGAGVGLSTGGDGVSLFDSANTMQAKVSFGTSPTGPSFPTFDNAAGLNNATLATLSSVGINGAFAAVNDANEKGSPGTIGAPPTPVISIVALDPDVSETGNDPGTFRISRTGSTVGSLTFSYTIATGAGQATGADYSPALTGAATIASGQSFIDLVITPVNDLLVEGNETLTLTLGDSGSYDVSSPGTATVTIADNQIPVFTSGPTASVQEANTLGVTGPSSSATPYVVSRNQDVQLTSIMTVGDAVGGYPMVGIPDGLGAFDNGDGTFTLLMNHELGSTSGVVRAHGAAGAFVSKWIINKSDLSVVSGADLMQQVYNWNVSTQQSNATTSTIAFNRFCSADLPTVSAYYNAATGLGTQDRIFMHGEEGGANGSQLATIVTGPDAGKTYVLGKFNLSTNGSGLTGVGAWENALANPYAQDKTIVIGNNDGGTGIMSNALAVYVGTKTNSGSAVDRAGLTNGTLKFVNVAGMTTEGSTGRGAAVAPNTPANGTAFTLSATSSTSFLRPEDGAWNPSNPSQYYFVTTDRLDQVSDGVGGTIGRSRLWRLTFSDITNPDAGGTIDLLIDGQTVDGEKVNMFDNLTVNALNGHVILQEDVGAAGRNGKIWAYDPTTNALVQLAQHDRTRFGDIGLAPTAPFSNDEETSGVIDMSSILGAGTYLLVDQAHYALGGALVEGGQLLMLRTNVASGPQFVTKLTATDAENNSLTYALAGGADASQFSVDSATGALRFVVAPNYESPTDANGDNVYLVQVSVSDGVNAPVVQSLQVTVNAVNESPSNTTVTAVSVPEGTTSVTTASGSDPEGTALTFALSGGADASKFAINATTGVLTFVTAPNFESPTDNGANNSYFVTVVVSDGANAPVNKTVQVTVTDVNEAPTAVNLSNTVASLPENTSTATRIKVADVSVTDDAMGTNVLSLSGADAGAFELLGGALYLKAGTTFDYEVKSSYAVTVNVDDATVGGTPDAFANFTLTVTDVNEAPTAVNLANTVASLPENASTATRIKVADVSVTDDALGTNVLSLTGADAGAFELLGGALYLKAGTTLDFEVKSNYAVTVNVDDATVGGTPDAFANFTLTATDVNEAPTAVNLANTVASLPENTSTATRIKVADVSVTDDALGTNVLSLSGADAGAFELLGGALYLKAGTTLDYEVKSNYAVTVNVDDATVGGTPDAFANFTLTVTDVNEAPTAVNLANTVASLPENTSTATRIKVADVSVTDDALGTNVLSLSGADAGAFELLGGSLYLKAGTVLNYEVKSSYAVTVNVDDATVGGTPDALANFNLSVIDGDNRQPVVFVGSDPLYPNRLALFVIGTVGDDHIEIEGQCRSNGLRVEIEGSRSSLAQTITQAVSRIIVYGGRGNDHIEVDDDVNQTTLLFGGDGNDHIEAGRGLTTIVGGAGDDHLEGGEIRDLLIGGLGADHLESRGGEDLLIGGATNFDDDAQALLALMEEWGRTDESYSQRVANLQNSPAGSTNPNGSYAAGYYLTGATVHSDGVGNRFEGGAGFDWYFANLDGVNNNGAKDKVSKLKSGELLTKVTL